MLPNFIIIGSQKSGTTSVYNILKNHPSFYFPDQKEINFFFHDSLYEKGVKHYSNLFTGSDKNKFIIGEASPGYICHPDSPQRIKKHIPNAKMLLILRNPIERAYSQYWDNRRKLSETNTFSQTIDKFLDTNYQPGKIGYFSRGVYIKHINNYLKYFNRDQMLILLFDDLINDPTNFYSDIFNFLDIEFDEKQLNFNKAYNSSFLYKNVFYRFLFTNPNLCKYIPNKVKSLSRFGSKGQYKYPKIPNDLHKKLSNFYKPFNLELSKFLNRDLSDWNH